MMFFTKIDKATQILFQDENKGEADLSLLNLVLENLVFTACIPGEFCSVFINIKL